MCYRENLRVVWKNVRKNQNERKTVGVGRMSMYDCDMCAKSHPSPNYSQTSLQLHPHTHHVVTPGLVDRPRWSDGTAGQMDGEAGWWTSSGKIGLPPLAINGVGRQQQYNVRVQRSRPNYVPSHRMPTFAEDMLSNSYYSRQCYRERLYQTMDWIGVATQKEDNKIGIFFLVLLMHLPTGF